MNIASSYPKTLQQLPSESEEAYQKWYALVLKLFEQFRYTYELLGPTPDSEGKGDPHLYPFLKEALKQQIPLLDGSPLQLPEDGSNSFQENHHVHWTRWYAFGAPVSKYPMGKAQVTHHNTLEEYMRVWGMPFFQFVSSHETIGYLFPTDHNYFLECTNQTFLNNPQYDISPCHPIYHPFHLNIFKPVYFQTALQLPPQLLKTRFQWTPRFSKKRISRAVRTLHFALTMLYSTALIESVYLDLFGTSWNPDEMVNFFQEHWQLPDGRYAKGLDPSHLNILAFLLLSLHPVATLLCYGFYRDKYGTEGEDLFRTTPFLEINGQIIPFKQFLIGEITDYLEACTEEIAYLENSPQESMQPLLTERVEQVEHAILLGGLFGIGYETEKRPKENIHYDKPYDFSSFAPTRNIPHDKLIARHSPMSPLWRIYYPFAGPYWSEPNTEVIIRSYEAKPTGNHEIDLRKLLIQTCHQYAIHFFQSYPPANPKIERKIEQLSQ